MKITATIFNNAAFSAVGEIYLTSNGTGVVTDRNIGRAEGRVQNTLVQKLGLVSTRSLEQVSVDIDPDYNEDLLHVSCRHNSYSYGCTLDMGELGIDVSKQEGGDGSLEEE